MMLLLVLKFGIETYWVGSIGCLMFDDDVVVVLDRDLLGRVNWTFDV